MPSKYGFGNTRKKSPVYKKPIYGEVQRNPIQKKMETLPGIDTKLDAKSPIRQSEQEEAVRLTPSDPAEKVKKSVSKIEIHKENIKNLKELGKSAEENLLEKGTTE
jgi:hypothetical protein